MLNSRSELYVLTYYQLIHIDYFCTDKYVILNDTQMDYWL